MRIVAALGGNALLRRGEPLTIERQRDNIRRAADALAPIALKHELIVTHGNGPQVGLLALQGEAYDPESASPLDVLDAETEGMIGYLIEQELINRLDGARPVATLLTQIEVDADDPAFGHPSKPIGPVYPADDANRIARERGWALKPDGSGVRRVVPSPVPRRILQIDVIRLMIDHGVLVVCAGGGGIPVVRRDDGSLTGIEAVIDKDLASAVLAEKLEADVLLMLTDVDAVYAHWNRPDARAIRRASMDALAELCFAEGSMGPKVAAARSFARTTGVAGIGRLEDAAAILSGAAGTLVTEDGDGIAYRKG